MELKNLAFGYNSICFFSRNIKITFKKKITSFLVGVNKIKNK